MEEGVGGVEEGMGGGKDIFQGRNKMTTKTLEAALGEALEKEREARVVWIEARVIRETLEEALEIAREDARKQT